MSAQKKTLLITGLTKGLGRALAIEFASLGHRVIGCGREKKDLQTLSSKLGASHQCDECDVADDRAVKDWAKSVLSSCGPPDILINNAGIINRNAPLWEISASDFDRLISINISGVANVLRHFLPAMINQDAGVIVNMSSTWGRTTSPEVAPYCASKWAIEGLTKSLADELPASLCCVALNPGIIDTAMLRSCFGDGARAYQRAEQWAGEAVVRILKIRGSDNGKSINV